MNLNFVKAPMKADSRLHVLILLLLVKSLALCQSSAIAGSSASSPEQCTSGNDEVEAATLLQVAFRLPDLQAKWRPVPKFEVERRWDPLLKLSHNKTCAKDGVNDAAFRHGLMLSERQFMPIYSPLPVGESSDSVERAVIYIHGIGQDANTYFCDGVLIADAQNEAASTLTMAPWFGNAMVPAQLWNPLLPSGSESIHWSGSSWLSGGDTRISSTSAGTYSSFTVLDKLVEHLENQKHNGGLPNLKQISIAGFSAGCQMASRWAFFSAAVVSANVQVIVADCSSYLYLNSLRPSPECAVARNTGPDHKCDSFGQPDGNEYEFNSYKYGLTFMGPENSYVNPFGFDLELTSAAIDAFSSKNVRFLLGKEDVCMCGAAGMENDPDLCFPKGTHCSPNYYQFASNDIRCCDTYPDTFVDNLADFRLGGMLQGSNRLQRGLNYVYYLQYFYAARGNTSYKATWGVFDGGHDSAASWSSPFFTEWVFGKKVAKPPCPWKGEDSNIIGGGEECEPTSLPMSRASVPNMGTWLPSGDAFMYSVWDA